MTETDHDKLLARELLRQRHEDAMSSAMTAAALDAAVEAAIADGFEYDDFTADMEGFRFQPW
jgi:hypothetical protein